MRSPMVAMILMLSVIGGGANAASPVFCVGPHVTSMTVEASQTTFKISSPSSNGSGDETAMSQRLSLVARSGVAPGVDVAGVVGGSTLQFSDLGSGYSDFDSKWSFLWGAAMRAGLPLNPRRVQVVASIEYFGYLPSGSSSNGRRTIESEYIWHELWPAVRVGGQFGRFVPFAGLTKPYLFGQRETRTVIIGASNGATAVQTSYRDADQALRGIAGVQWNLPEGYAITGEAQRASDGGWTLAISVAQALR